MSEKSRHTKGLEWCPEADLNHRHADFQPVFAVGILRTWVKFAVKHPHLNQLLSSVLSRPYGAYRAPGEGVPAVRISASSDAYRTPVATMSNGRGA